MIIETALTTMESALWVASVLDAAVKADNPDEYFELVTVDKQNNLTTLWLQPDPWQDFSLAVDSSQVVRCVSIDDRRVDILLPKLHIRADNPATVVIGPEDAA